MEATETMTTQVPTSVLIAIGVLVVCNLGVIVSVVTIIFKAGKFVTATEMGIKYANASAVRAHKRIDELAKEIET